MESSGIEENSSVRRVLIVSNDTGALEGTVSLLSPALPGWDIHTESDSRRAVERVSLEPYDAIISDYEMVELDGVELLDAVTDIRPLMIRCLASGAIGTLSEARALSVAHHFFGKPLEADVVNKALSQATALRDHISVQSCKELLSAVSGVPSPPKTYMRLRSLMAREEFHARELVDVLKQEISLTALILKAANSSYYGSRSSVTTLDRAVALLGLNTVKSLTLGAELFARFDADTAKVFKLDKLWQHSIDVAATASAIAARSPETAPLQEEAYTAGLVHDAGKLVFVHALPKDYLYVTRRAEKHKVHVRDVEQAIFGVDHQQAGAYLLQLWGLPETIVEAVAYHNQPRLCTERRLSVLACVVAANLLSPSAQRPAEANGEEEQDYLLGVGLNYATDFVSRPE